IFSIWLLLLIQFGTSTKCIRVPEFNSASPKRKACPLSATFNPSMLENNSLVLLKSFVPVVTLLRPFIILTPLFIFFQYIINYFTCYLYDEVSDCDCIYKIVIFKHWRISRNVLI